MNRKTLCLSVALAISTPLLAATGEKPKEEIPW